MHRMVFLNTVHLLSSFHSLYEFECAAYDWAAMQFAWFPHGSKHDSESLALIWGRLAFPPFQFWLEAVSDCTFNSRGLGSIMCSIQSISCPQDLHSLLFTIVMLRMISAQSNECNPHSRLSFFISGKRWLAGCSDPLISDFTYRRTRKRSLWHFQLIPLTPPPAPPHLLSLHSHIIPSSIPHPHPPQPHWDWMWWTVCSHKAGDVWGLGRHYHHYGQNSLILSVEPRHR